MPGPGLRRVIAAAAVVEELLREVHGSDAGPAGAAILFACFLPFFLAGIAVR